MGTMSRMSSAPIPEGLRSSSDPDATAVVAHARFVRSLARGLVRDECEADELAARAMAEAIARPPRAGAALREWLRRVVWRLFWRERRDAERRRRT